MSISDPARFLLRRPPITRPAKKLVTLMFGERINVVWGASNSGKSYIVKALDFMSGAKTPLPPITEAQGYDKCWLELELPVTGTVTLERAKQQLSVPPGRTSVVALGGELSLWNPVLLDWLVWMKKRHSEIGIRANVGVPDQLIEQLRTGVLDIAVLYAPPLLPGFRIELVEEEELVLVRTPQLGEEGQQPDYVHVDWGPQFAAAYGFASATAEAPGLAVGLGPLGLSYILRAGGMGYFRRGAVKPHLEKGELELVVDAPRYTYPAYAIYPEGSEVRGDLQAAIEGLKQVVR